MWTQDTAEYHGRFVDFTDSWAWPKPTQRPYPPIVIGGGWGPRLLAAVVRHADGWLPVSGRSSIQARIDLLHAECERQGRDPSTVSITVADAKPDLDSFRSLESEGVERVTLSVPVGSRDDTLRVLDRYGELARAAA